MKVRIFSFWALLSSFWSSFWASLVSFWASVRPSFRLVSWLILVTGLLFWALSALTLLINARQAQLAAPDPARLGNIQIPQNRPLIAMHLASNKKEDLPALYSYQIGYKEVQNRIDWEPIEAVGYLQGVSDALLGLPMAVPDSKIQEIKGHYYMQAREQYLFEMSKQRWAKVPKLPGVIASPSGYYYQIVHQGAGPKADPKQFAVYYYRTYLLSGNGIASALRQSPVTGRIKATQPKPKHACF